MMHRKSREMAFCGVLCALATAILLLGGVIPIATYCAPLLALLVLLPVLTEFGVPAAWTAYAAVSLLGLLLVPDKETAAVYLFFGYYPIIQPLFSRIRLRGIRILAKLAYCNLTVLVLYTLLIRLFATGSAANDFRGMSGFFLTVLILLGNVLFLAMDLALGRMEILWKTKLRKLFFRS
jgi:hypothetical protein